jgi:hypothetical protein
MSIIENRFERYKMVCIGNKVTGSNQYQTPGKVYEIINDKGFGQLSFIGDDGVEYLFFKHDPDFITIEEWRQRKINSILGDGI